MQSEPAAGEMLIDDSCEDLGDVLMVNNPVALLLLCEDNIFLCIGEVIGIHLGSRAVDYLQFNVLLEDTIHVTYQVYDLVTISIDSNSSNDNTQKHD